MQAENQGVLWEKRADHSIWWWDATSGQWIWWDPNMPGPQPPPPFFTTPVGSMPAPVIMPVYAAPAATSHGAGYWIFVGWWWGPAKFLGRLLLWIVFCPVGLWRSIVHHTDKRHDRMRRGITQANERAMNAQWAASPQSASPRMMPGLSTSSPAPVLPPNPLPATEGVGRDTPPSGIPVVPPAPRPELLKPEDPAVE